MDQNVVRLEYRKIDQITKKWIKLQKLVKLKKMDQNTKIGLLKKDQITKMYQLKK